MTTTITLEDDALQIAHNFARSHALGLGQAISELIRRGHHGARLPLRNEGGVWVFELPPETPRVTARQVRALLEGSP